MNKNPSSKELKDAKIVDTRRRRTDEELLNCLKIFYEENGRVPTDRDFTNNLNYPGALIYQKHFGSLNSSLRLLGLYDRDSYCKYSDEELLGHLVEFRKENGRIPVAKDFYNNSEYPTFVTYQKRFGSWNNALNLAGLDKREKCGRSDKYTDEELLLFLIIYFEENGKVPAKRDFANNPDYPDYQNYTAHFRSWGNALKMVGLDLDTMVEQGNLKTEKQRGRLVEIIVRDNFGNKPIDLSGNNPSSIMDGICPNGQTYEVKSAKLLTIGKWSGWPFATHNKDKDDDREAIQWYYFAAFNEDYTKLYHMWRVPGEIVEKTSFVVGMYGGEFTVENMTKYDITDKFKDVIPTKNKNSW